MGTALFSSQEHFATLKRESVCYVNQQSGVLVYT